MEYSPVVLTGAERISQKTLQELNDIRTVLAAKTKQRGQLKKDVGKLKYEEEGLNNELVDLLNQGHKVSRGKFTACVKILESLPRLAWKQVFIKIVRNGEARAKKILAEREPNKKDYVEISVRE